MKDALASRDFYESVVGFEVVAVQSPGQVWVRSGEMEILLRKVNAPISSRYETSSSGIVQYTDDLDSTARDLSHRGLEFRCTVDTDKCLTLTDLDGHWFQLINPNDL